MASGGHERQFTVGEGNAGLRLDQFLPRAMEAADEEGPGLADGAGSVAASRSAVQGWIREGRVTVNGRAVKPRHSVAAGDRVAVSVPAPVSGELEAEAMDLSILYEDEDLVVVDKPPGLVVHPGSGNGSRTLVNGLLHHCGGRLCPLAGEDRPGVVHRLDKDTSGCLVAAKSERAYRSLVAQFSERRTGKEYLAVVAGVPTEPSGTLETRIGRHPVNRQKMAVLPPPAGKEAVTDYRIVRADPERRWAALSCVIRTGRTHQIRVHLKECLRCPILGDAIYGETRRGGIEAPRLMLHAWKLDFDHPESDRRMRFEAPVPEAFVAFLDETG